MHREYVVKTFHAIIGLTLVLLAISVTNSVLLSKIGINMSIVKGALWLLACCWYGFVAWQVSLNDSWAPILTYIACVILLVQFNLPGVFFIILILYWFHK